MKNHLPPTFSRHLLLILVLASFQLPVFGQAYANALRTPAPVHQKNESVIHRSQNENTRSVSAILFALEEAYHISFNYDHAVVSGFRLREDFTWKKDEKIERVLKRLTQQAALEFEKVDEGNYLIYARKKESRTRKINGTSLITAPESTMPSVDLSALVQQNAAENQAIALNVSGVVRDETNNPLPGVNVMVKGTTNGTTTDSDGKYVVSVSDGGDVLIFSFIGYTTQEVAVSDRSVIDVSMAPDVTSLQEVVVVGYGEQKRTNVLGSVANIKTEEVQDIPAANLSTILQGRMPGVHIGQSSGRPGAPTTLSIRTRGSWNNEPVLFVIDGFIRDQAAFDLLDPTEIDNISVLKDAAAAVYGARASGGVVLVKTKRGKTGKAKINYSGSYGVSEATQFTDMLSAYDHALLVNNKLKITNPTNYETQANWFTDDELEQFRSLDHNWLDEAWKNSSTVRHTVNVGGGSETVRYFGSVSYYDEKGNLPGTELKKHTLRMGLDADITKDLTASLTLSGDNKLDEMPFNTEDNNPDPMDGTFKTLLMAPRWIPSYINGLPVNGPIASHPLEVDRINSYIRSKTSNIVLNAALEYNVPVVEGLRLKMAYSMAERNTYGKQHRIGYQLYNFEMTGGHNHLYTDVISGNPVRIKNDERLQETYDRGTNYQLNGSVMYDRAFGLHNVGALLVYEQAENEGNGILAMREENVIEGYERQEGFSEAFDRTSSSQTAFSRLSYIGRVNYNYAEKYLLEAAFRYEGSVRFMPSTRWGFFPSVAAGWRISEEQFFKNNVRFINNLKLRGSAGLVGNDDVAPRQWELSYGIATGSYLGGSSVTNGLNPRNSGIIATAVTWEKSKSYNGGIDIGFTNRINLAFDYFRRYTYDILDSRNAVLPTSTGIDKMPKENYGKMQSWGFDASIGYDGEAAGGDLTYHLGMNVSWAKSKVVEKFQSPGVIGTWEDEIGRMPGGEPGFIALGIIRSQEELDAFMEAHPGYTIDEEPLQVGMLYYKDVGGPDRSDIPDGVIDDNDRRIIAPAVSALGFNFNLGAGWKGIKVNAIIGLGGFRTKEFFDKEALTAPTEKLNGPAFWSDHWTPENPMAAYPRPANYGMDGQKSTFWMRDGLSMELNVLNVSYDMPKSWSQKLGFPQIRIYFSGRNLWNIINPLEYKDPSISRFNSYPTLRTYNFGLNLSL